MPKRIKCFGFYLILINILFFSCSKIDKEKAEEHYQKGLTFQRIEHFDSALVEFKQAINLFPKHIYAHQQYIRIIKRDLWKAKEILNEYKEKLNSNPNSEFYNYLYGFSLYTGHISNQDEFEKIALAVVSLNPNFYWGHHLLGDFYTIENNNNKAIREYKKAILIDSSEGAAFDGLGRIYAKLDSFSLSIASYRKAIQSNYSKFYDSYLGLWEIMLKKEQQSKEARELIKREVEKTVANNEDNVFLLNSALSIYRMLGMEEKIKAIEDRILKFYPLGNPARSVLELRYRKIVEPYERLEFCEKIIKNHPSYSTQNQFYDQGMNLFLRTLKSEREKAIAWGESWIKDYPEEFFPPYYLGQYYSRHTINFNEAIKHTKNSVELADEYMKSISLLSLGNIYFKNKMYHEAISSIEEGDKLLDAPRPYYMARLGFAYGKIGEIDKALEILALALVYREEKESRKYFNQLYLEKNGSLEGSDDFLKNAILSKARIEPFPAPNFKLISLTGDTTSWSDFNNKVVLVVFGKPG